MKDFIKNILLLAVVLILSYFTAEYFGSWYDKFSPQYDDSFFSFTKQELVFIVGIPFAYIFFVIILFKTFAWGNRDKWTLWLLAPALIFFGSGDIQHIYLLIILGLIALGLATLLRKVLKLV